MLSKDACLGARQTISSDDFHRLAHGRIFSALSEPMDAVGLAGALGNDLESCGGRAYLIDLQDSRSSNWRHYAEIVKKSADSRRMIVAGTDITTMGYDGRDCSEAVAVALSLARDPNRSVDLADLMARRVEAYAKPTDYFVFPASAVKLHYGDFTILAGRPGTGKTAYAMVAAYFRAAIDKVAFFTYEMNADELGDRFISHLTNLPTEYTYDGLNPGEMEKYGTAVQSAGKRNLRVVECGGMSESQLASSLALFAAGGGRIAVIDYLQIAYDASHHGENADITRLSKMLRRIAKANNLAILGISQFRRYEGADDGEKKITYPKMSDLRGSGSLEQDAANICLMYAYPPATSALGTAARRELRETEHIASDMDTGGTLLRLHWAKVRHGRSGQRTWVMFDGSGMSFTECDTTEGRVW